MSKHHAMTQEEALLIDRDEFWSKAHITGDDECWEWRGSRNRNGYGRWFKGGFMTASRLAYIISYGPITSGLCVCHHCDNPPCINPNHLFLATREDNTKDARAKGLIRYLYGHDNPSTKVSDHDVARIRNMKGMTYRDMGRLFGISPAQVCRIRKHHLRKLSHS